MAPSKKDAAVPDGALPAEATDRVRALARLLDETGLTEIEIEQSGMRLRVARHNSPAYGVAVSPASPAAPAPAAAPVAEVAPDALASHPGVLRSPMVGIAYTSADPNSPPFVKVGDTVVVGQTLLLIEAMKVFNPIKATRAGKVARIFITSGAPVEYGEPLALIE